MQDDIAARVAGTLALEVDEARLAIARRTPLASLEIYDCWLRGLDCLQRGTVEADAEAAGFGVLRDVDATAIRGRVLSVHGLSSVIRADDGRQFRCAVRGLLKDLSTDLRHVVVAGDIVWIRPEAAGDSLIERIEPRQRILSRTSNGRQQILVANVDRLVIVASAAEPILRPARIR